MTILRGSFSLLIIIFIITAVLFVDFTYKTFSLPQSSVKTDAVVVLAGGRGRVEEGLRLYRMHRSARLFLIGVDPAVKRRDLFKERPGEKGSIFLEKVSRNTLENAIYAREMLISENIHSITLLTSRYHMKRAVLIFRNLLPKDIVIYTYPIDSKNFKDEWWNHSGSFRLLFNEFYKYCLFKFFFLFGSGELRPIVGA